MKNYTENYQTTVDTSIHNSISKAIEIIQADSNKAVERPDFSPKKGIIKALGFIAFFTIIFVLLLHYKMSIMLILIPIFITTILFAKKAVLWLILFYQKYAPEHIRCSCLFYPSCSQYMILAINKYGLIKGLLKGTKRIFRCHPPNGGEDYP